MVKDSFNPKWLYAVWGALGFNGGSFIGVLISLLLICTPLTAYWESFEFGYTKEYTCINGNILSPLVGALSIATDVIATVLPCAMLHYYDLQVPRGQKIGLNIIFALSTM